MERELKKGEYFIPYTSSGRLHVLHVQLGGIFGPPEEQPEPKPLFEATEIRPYSDLPNSRIRRRWASLRNTVFERDGGICQVCGFPVSPFKGKSSSYECGHIIDRMIGGPDKVSNLLCMCSRCNQWKPLHESIAEFEAWRQAGAWWPSFVQAVGREIWAEVGCDMDQLLRNEGWTPPTIDYSKLDVPIINRRRKNVPALHA